MLRGEMVWSSALVVLALVGFATPAAVAEPARCVFQPSGDVEALDGCAAGAGLLRATGAALTPDGGHLFVAATRSSAVAALARDPASGQLTWRGCVSDNGTDGVDGTGGRCVDGHALKGAKGLAVSPDGRNLYVAATRSGAIDTFSLDGPVPVQVGCIKESALDSRCDEGRGLGGSRSVAVSPDGRHVYVAAASGNGVSWLSRDAATGRLQMGGCVSADGSDGACADGRGLLLPTGVSVSENGQWVHVAAYGSGAVTSFSRDPVDGHLTQMDCVMADPPPGGSCRRVGSLAGAYGIATGRGGEVAVGARGAGALTLLRTNPGTGELSAVACASAKTKGCVRAPGLGAVEAVAVRGRVIAATSAGGTVAVLRWTAGKLTALRCFAAVARRRSPCSAVPAIAGAAGVVLSEDGAQAYVAADEAQAVQRLETGATR